MARRRDAGGYRPEVGFIIHVVRGSPDPAPAVTEGLTNQGKPSVGRFGEVRRPAPNWRPSGHHFARADIGTGKPPHSRGTKAWGARDDIARAEAVVTPTYGPEPSCRLWGHKNLRGLPKAQVESSKNRQ